MLKMYVKYFRASNGLEFMQLRNSQGCLVLEKTKISIALKKFKALYL